MSKEKLYQIDKNTQYAKVVKLKDGIYLTKMIDWDVYSQILKGNGVEQKITSPPLLMHFMQVKSKAIVLEIII